jgi:hypothetical protein
MDVSLVSSLLLLVLHNIWNETERHGYYTDKLSWSKVALIFPLLNRRSCKDVRPTNTSFRALNQRV